MISETLAELVRKHVTVLGEIEARQQFNADIHSEITRPLHLFKSDKL